MPDTEFKRCDPADYRRVLSLLDLEFLTSRGRTGSMETRYPEVLHRGNPHNIFVATRNRIVCSALVTKTIALGTSERVCMIGMVTTEAASRGLGLASKLLRFAQHSMEAAGISHCILWTTLPNFYRRLGWVSSDLNCVAILDGSNQSPSDDNIRPATARRAAEIREIWSPSLPSRTLTAWNTVPVHADVVELVFAKGGFALVGSRDDTGYVYEVQGPQDAFATLLETLQRKYRRIVCNDRIGGLWMRWLSRTRQVSWRPSHLAMHLPCKRPLTQMAYDLRYLPIIDRI